MRQWTDQQRKEAATRARLNRPWLDSTGPRTPLGKQKSSHNSYKHGRFTYEKKILRWYLRFAIMRNNYIRTYLNYENQKRENELIAKYGMPIPFKPDRRAFFPYFKVHPLEGAWKRKK